MGLNTQSFDTHGVVRRMMLFIDGGYLRKYLKDMFNDDSLNYSIFLSSLIGQLSTSGVFFRINENVLL